MSGEVVGESKGVVIERVRALPRPLGYIVTIAALLVGVYEILFVFNFNYTLYDMFSRVGVGIDILKLTFQTKQGEAFILAMVLLMAFLLYPIRKKEEHFKGVPIYDYALLALGVLSLLYAFLAYPRYAELAEVTKVDIIFGIIALALILEATRRVVGWVLPLIVMVFLLYGINDIGFNLARFTQQLYFDEGIFGIPLFVMVTYVFAFMLFGAFLLKIGVADYITMFMMRLLGDRPGGPAKVAVVASALEGTVSGSSVANVLESGSFTIPTMKRAGYPPEIAGAIEPAASTGGQIMPPVLGAAAFIMAEFLGVPYSKIMIAAVIPALIYFTGLYIFIDLETKRLGLRGISVEELKPLGYFLRKIYLLSPIPVIVIALTWGIAPHIAAISSLGVAVWVAWISREEVKGHEWLYVCMVIFTLFTMFASELLSWLATPLLLILSLALVCLAFTTDLVHFNEKLYISLAFMLLVALTNYLGMSKEQILLISGIMGILFSYIVGYASKSEEGRRLSIATYESMIEAGKMSVAVMLAAASAGLIQGVLTMTGLITRVGYTFVELAAGNLILLLVLTMAFSLILGMGVPTTANYIITSLVAAPAIFKVVENIAPYNQPIPGYATAIALLAAHFFAFYYGVIADITPPVALASYAGAALAGADFWKTAINATKYALAAFIGPYIYFFHPEMFLITVTEWDLLTVLKLLYYIAATVLIIYLLAIGIVGFYGMRLKKWVRAILAAIGLAGITLDPTVVGIGFAAWIGLKFYVSRATK